MTDPSETPLPQTPGGVLTHHRPVAFHVHQAAYDGPFDLLLGLISKHRLDITEIALAAVTDEFIAHLREAQQAAAEAQAAGDRAASAWLVLPIFSLPPKVMVPMVSTDTFSPERPNSR